MLYSLQYARAIAALFVVHAHLAGFPLFAAAAPSGVGGLGVDIFFVISGYIMWHTARDMPAGRFVLRRLVRIVPIYWFYTLLLVAVALVLPGLAPRIEVTAQTVLGSLFFIPYVNAAGGVQPILLQGWTLNYEMFFYAVFALCLFLTTVRSRFVGVVATFTILAVVGALARPSDPVLASYTDSILIEFVMGMSLAAIPAGGKRPTWLMGGLVVVAVAALVLADFGMMGDWPRFVSHGIAAAALVWALVQLEEPIQQHPSRSAVALGDASYSLYLCHPFILSTVAALGRLAVNRGWLAEGLLTSLLLSSIAMVACCLAAVVSFRFIERPLGKLLGGLLGSDRQPFGATGLQKATDSTTAG